MLRAEDGSGGIISIIITEEAITIRQEQFITATARNTDGIITTMAEDTTTAGLM